MDNIKRQLKQDLYLIALSGIIGLTSLFSLPRFAPLILLIPVFWTLARTRTAAFMVVLVYHLAISRGLAPGARVFLSAYENTFSNGLILWFLMSLGVALPFGLFWSLKRRLKASCLFGAFLTAYFLPPIALIGVENPMMAAGCLFPGLGWYGLIFLSGLYLLCAVSRRIALIFIACILLMPALNVGGLQAPKLPEGFLSINTSFGRLGSGSFDFQNDFERINMVFQDLRSRKIREADSHYILLPETIGGRLNRPGMDLWQREFDDLLREDQTILFGAELPTGDGLKYDNALIMLSQGKFQHVAQRIPVPYSMYRPFSKIGANLHLWDDGILPLPGGGKAAVVVCYEAFLTLPYMVSMIEQPDLLICVANMWWCRETSLTILQKRNVALWAQLFGVPVAYARNH